MKFCEPPGTSSGRWPTASMAPASSVKRSPACSIASIKRPMRNICGVWASHLSSRLSVPATRPPRSVLSVSTSFCASRPPTSSPSQASIRLSIICGVIRQRAASCTSTQSRLSAPSLRSSCRPLTTLIALDSPPQAAAVTGAKLRLKKPSPCATTTRVLAMRLTAAKAASVCITIGLPAIGSYCLGPVVPARLPWPAQGIRAKNRVLGMLSLMVLAPF